MKNLQEETVHTLKQLQDFLRLIPDTYYYRSISILQGNTIGKHIRHIIEFYQTLLENTSGLINYDLRERNLILENNKETALEKLAEIAGQVQQIDSDYRITVEGDYSECGSVCSRSSSSLSRELAYNLEHIVHHMAIMRIGIEFLDPSLVVSENFGVARSTWRHLQKQPQVQVS